MSEANVGLVRRAFDAFTAGDIDEVPVGTPQRRGHQGVLEAFSLWPEQWDDFRIEIDRVLADPGDYVVVKTLQSGRGKHSGIEVVGEFTFLFAIRNERIAEWRIFVHEEQALAAIGGAE